VVRASCANHAAHLAHVEGNNEQHGGQRGEWDVDSQGREHEEYQQDRHGMCESGDRAVSAWPDARGRSSDGTRCGESAKESRTEVRQTLSDEFLFGSCFVPVIPSATLADSRDSIAPRSATAIAGWRSVRIVAGVGVGSSREADREVCLRTQIRWLRFPVDGIRQSPLLQQRARPSDWGSFPGQGCAPQDDNEQAQDAMTVVAG